MRIWDINPGYLNRQSLLGEHRELHGIVSIIVNGKYGYGKHPYIIRWVGYGWALKLRQKQLVGEMALRGYTDKSPVNTRSGKGHWSNTYIDYPQQFALLEVKYKDREKGRIPLPKNEQQLWGQHKYSVLARCPELYKKIGRDVSKATLGFGKLSVLLTETLRKQPPVGGIRNAVQYMWGYVSDNTENRGTDVNAWSLCKLLSETQKLAIAHNNSYLICSFSLSELMVWL